jgi:uncharacterized protein (DUF3820 family)
MKNTKTYPPRTLTDKSPCFFGKHKGGTWGEVPDEYLEWLWAQDWFQNGDYADIKAYIVLRKSDNREDEVPMSYPDPAENPTVNVWEVGHKTNGELFHMLCKKVLPVEACIKMCEQGIIAQENMALFAKLEAVNLVQMMAQLK